MIISKHAVEKAKIRVYQYRNKSDAYILQDLKKKLETADVAEYARRAAGAREICCDGISLVINFSLEQRCWAVVTCLGDQEYRHWLRRQERQKNRISTGR